MKTTDTKHLIRAALVGALVATTAASQAASSSTAGTGKRPNIVIILGDDLGFSDIGAFGSEIKTPTLDALAEGGVRFTQFYTHATCSPTRSMLLSGVDTHRNGLGNMDEWTAPNQMGKPGYEGYLNDRVATLPQLLKDTGYHTYMVGKWHMGKAPQQIPAARGFERDFSLLDGAGSYWTWRISPPQPVVHVHRGWPLLEKAAQRLLRHEDLHRQTHQLHRSEPRRRQTVLRLRFAPGASRPVSSAARLALPARR